MQSISTLGSSPVSEEALKPICLAIGYFVVYWTMIDSAASICVNIGYKHSAAKKEEVIPLEFKRKIGFIRKCLNTSELRPLKQNADKMLDKVIGVSKTRDFVVHGTIRSFNSPNQVFVFSKLDKSATKMDHVESYLEITGIDLAKTANLCGDLASEFQKLADRFYNSLVIK